MRNLLKHVRIEHSGIPAATLRDYFQYMAGFKKTLRGFNPNPKNKQSPGLFDPVPVDTPSGMYYQSRYYIQNGWVTDYSPQRDAMKRLKQCRQELKARPYSVTTLVWERNGFSISESFHDNYQDSYQRIRKLKKTLDVLQRRIRTHRETMRSVNEEPKRIKNYHYVLVGGVRNAPGFFCVSKTRNQKTIDCLPQTPSVSS